MILYVTEGFVEILGQSKKSLHGDLANAMSQRGWCLGRLLGGSCANICEGRSRFFFDDLACFSSGSWHEDLFPVSLKVFVKSSGGDPSAMLSVTFA